MSILPPLTVSRTGANICFVERIQSEETVSPRESHAECSHRTTQSTVQSDVNSTPVHIKPQASDIVAIGQPPPYTIDTVGDAPPDSMETSEVSSTPPVLQSNVAHVDDCVSSREPAGESK